MKFRRLTNEELSEMETEFVRFLVANTVTGEDWVQLKKEKPDKAEALIELFSDIVFEKILGDIKFLEYKTAGDIKTFQCLEEKIIMRGIMIDGKTEIDFTKNPDPKELAELVKSSGAKVRVYSAEKAYKNGREQELFKMLEAGCLISKGELFQTLEQF